jgi:hypothetical protein
MPRCWCLSWRDTFVATTVTDSELSFRAVEGRGAVLLSRLVERLGVQTAYRLLDTNSGCLFPIARTDQPATAHESTLAARSLRDLAVAGGGARGRAGR